MKRLIVAVMVGCLVGFLVAVAAFMSSKPTIEARADIVCPPTGYHYTPKSIGDLYGRFLDSRVDNGPIDDGELLHTTYDIIECVHGN
jgi:hypothetical protein